MNTPKPDFVGLLQVLVEHQVEFIIIGGLSAILQGASLVTLDVDVVHARTPENVDRLVAALQELDAYFREHPTRRLRPDRSHLSSPGHQLLITRHGALDLLGTVTGERGYQELLPHTVERTVAEGMVVRLLDLPTLILLKEETGRDKDRAMLPLLRRTLEERQKQQP